MSEVQPVISEQSSQSSSLWSRVAGASVVQRYNPLSEVNKTAARLARELTAENGFCLRHSDAGRTNFQNLVRERLLERLANEGIVPRSLEPITELGPAPAELPHAEQVKAVYDRAVARLTELGEKGDDETITLGDVNIIGVIRELTRGSDRRKQGSIANRAASQIFDKTEFEESSVDPPYRRRGSAAPTNL